MYKCALYVYFYRALGSAGSHAIGGVGDYVLEKCLHILGSAQDLNGGLRTYYRSGSGGLEMIGDTNV